MPDPELSFTLISTVAAVVSAVGGAFATLAAFRSAELAKAAIQRSDATEQRRACGDVMELAQRVAAEHSRATGLLLKLERETKAYSGLSGGGSWLEQRLQHFATLRRELEPLDHSSVKVLPDYKALLKLSDDEIAGLSSGLRADLARLRVLKEEIRDDLEHLREENRLQRELTSKRITG